MATTLNLSNVNNPAPLWFTRLKNAVSIISNAAVVILLALGYKDNSFLILVSRVGISALLDALNAIIGTDGQPPKI